MNDRSVKAFRGEDVSDRSNGSFRTSSIATRLVDYAVRVYKLEKRTRMVLAYESADKRFAQQKEIHQWQK